MVSNIIKQEKFYNGLLLICASGIGDSLEIPSAWPDNQIWAKTSNALFIDFRNLNDDDLDTTASVYIIDEVTKEYTQIIKAEIDAPKRKIYVGDSLKEVSVVIPIDQSKATITAYSKGSAGVADIYLKFKGTNS